ncbi:MAG: DUF4922 domain-containing protein [Prevotellaceae bacterium]|jgi:hypothetical protein|nr:DUF4922 domain-containing protein [Prevotellaceae bacterium]
MNFTNFINSQLSEWELARKNYAGLQAVETKTFNFNGFSVLVQFNPARIVSSGAKVDAAAIAQRKCFLCAENRPKEQKGIDVLDYELLVNPFPVFPQHFTIASKAHQPQRIEPYFADLLYFAQLMPDYVVFFNAEGCGASAPDHLHFQAGTKEFLPLIADYKALKPTNGKAVYKHLGVEILLLENYLRTVYCIEAATPEAAKAGFDFLYPQLPKSPMKLAKINIVAHHEGGKYYVFVFPRAASRPQQYCAEKEEDRLLVSPASVEMGGVIIVPLKADFEKITKEDIVSIYSQVSANLAVFA